MFSFCIFYYYYYYSAWHRAINAIRMKWVLERRGPNNAREAGWENCLQGRTIQLPSVISYF